MKKFIITLVLVFATVMNVSAMSKYRASREARFLTDKMAWELDLSYSQMEDVYEINYDYFRHLVSVHSNYNHAYEIRNEELSFVLTPRQWARFIAIEYFYIPVHVHAYSWVFPIYTHYRKDHFYYDAPHAYSHYTGGHAHNLDFYRGRTEIHIHAFDHGYKPHTSGHIGPAHGMTRAEANRHGGNTVIINNNTVINNNNHNNGHNNNNARPQGHNNNSVKPQGNHNQQAMPQGNNHNNVKPQSNHNQQAMPQGNNHNNVKPQGNQQSGNRQQGAVPNRNTTNRSTSATHGTRSNSGSNNTSARPTRSQNAQNAGGAKSGRR